MRAHEQRRALGFPWLLVLILLAHASLGVIYSVTVPPWEAHDEIGHYHFARYLAIEHRLPPPGTKVSEHNDESHQPPLYYILGALATAWVDTSDRVQPVSNPYAATEGGDAGANMAVHDPEVEGFPYRGTILALHVARLVSVTLGTLGLVATYGIGRRVFPARPEIALGGTAINALWPQYLFIGSVVTNDIMVTVCTSWFLLFLVHLLGKGARLRDWMGMGLSLSCALLSKNNALALVPVAAVGSVVALARTIRRKGPTLRSLIGISVLVAALISTSGWWYARNARLYGGVFGQYMSRATPFFDLFAQPITHLDYLHWGQLPAMFRYGFITFWASFGWGNLGLDPGAYVVAAIVCVLGIAGMILLLIRKRTRRAEFLMLGFAIVCIVIVPVYLNLGVGSPYLRGRLCMPMIAPVSILLTAGWGGLLRPYRARWVLGAIVAAMGLEAVFVPFWVIGPTYARPPQLTAGEMQTITRRVNYTFGPAIQLIGYDLREWRVKPGERLPVTLYWRALAKMEENYTLSVKVIGQDGEAYGARHLFPGRGNFATSLWKEGDCFRETYWVPVEAQGASRVVAHVDVSFFRHDSSQTHLLVRDDSGRPPGGSAVFGRIKIAGTPLRRVPSHEVSYQLGERIGLVGYDLPVKRFVAGEDLGMALYWEARDRIVEDYQVFVHLVNAEGKTVAQGDSPPMGGAYPTGLWEKDELIVDDYLISLPCDLPSGQYQLLAGLYVLDTLVRLPASTSAGQRLLADAIPIDDIEVRGLDHRIFLPLTGGWG